MASESDPDAVVKQQNDSEKSTENEKPKEKIDQFQESKDIVPIIEIVETRNAKVRVTILYEPDNPLPDFELSEIAFNRKPPSISKEKLEEATKLVEEHLKLSSSSSNNLQEDQETFLQQIMEAKKCLKTKKKDSNEES